MTDSVSQGGVSQDSVIQDSGTQEPEVVTAYVPTVAVTRAPDPVPVPVLAPYLGLVAAVLSVLAGSWLLLAPYALDLRHGAARLPRAAQVDLETGAAIVAVGIVTAALFSLTLVRRLRTEALLEEAAAPQAEDEPETELEEGPREDPEPPSAAPQSADAPRADPGGSLREMLTPLVAALAADLRSQNEHQAGQDRAGHDQAGQEP